MASTVKLVKVVNGKLQQSATGIAQLLLYGLSGVGVAGVTRYLSPGTAPALIAEIAVPVPRDGVLRNLRARALTGPGVGSTDTLTVRVGAADTAITTTLTGTGVQAAADLVNTASVAAGDLVSVSLITGALSVIADLVVTFEVTPE